MQTLKIRNFKRIPKPLTNGKSKNIEALEKVFPSIIKPLKMKPGAIHVHLKRVG